MNEKLFIPFTSQVVPVKPINEQMTLCKCYVLALGKNRKKTSISKEAADDALSSLYNIPVVGHLYVDKDGKVWMGGHDQVIEKGADGVYRFRTLTVPYGVVPQQDNVHYEEVTESDGVTRTYMVADVILWTGKYPELMKAVYSKDMYFSQSMEITPTAAKRENGYLVIDKFQFSALCLLCKSDDEHNVEPCFESACVEPYDFCASDEWTKRFEEFKTELARAYSVAHDEEGGKPALNKEQIIQIMLEFGLGADSNLPFEVADGMSEEEFRAKLQETFGAANQEETAAVVSNPDVPVIDNGQLVSTEDTSTEAQDTANFAKQETETVEDDAPANEPLAYAAERTYREKAEALDEALSKLGVSTDAICQHYYLIDFDSEYVYANLFYCNRDGEERNETYRIPYSVDADGGCTLDTTNQEPVRLVWLTKADEEKLAAQENQLRELTEYKQAKLEEERNREFAAVLAEFPELQDLDEYRAVVSNVATFESPDALCEKMYALRGKYNLFASKPSSQSPSDIRIPVGVEAHKGQNEMEEFMNRYCPRRAN